MNKFKFSNYKLPHMPSAFKQTISSSGGNDLDEFLKRVDLQWPEKDKIDMADFIIYNNSSKDDLKKEAKKIFNQLQ